MNNQIRWKTRILQILILTTILNESWCSHTGTEDANSFFLKPIPLARNEGHNVTVSKSVGNAHDFVIIPLGRGLGDTDSSEHAIIGTSTARIQEILDTDEVDGQVTSDLPGSFQHNETSGMTAVNFNYMFGGYVRREIWAIPLLSLIFLNLCLIVFFEVYVLCHARGQNPLFLGQFLLLGLALCAGCSLVFVVSPGYVNCFLGTIGISVSYALIFSVLMVKAIFLISLDSGNNLTLTYQASLLFFSVLVQAAISAQSSLIFPPSIDHAVNSSSGVRSLWSECEVGFDQMLWPMISYNIFLIVFVGVLAIKIRKIQENYGEATYIGFAILATIPIWICWILAACVLHGRHLDACVAFGCQAQSLFTFLIIFMPKGRQLATLASGGKLLAENQEDEFSPSFLHIDPGKFYKKGGYGVDRYSPNSCASYDAPTFSAMNPNVYYYRTDFHPGMIY